MIDLLNLAFPYFSLIFVGFACGKFKQIPESGLEWINFFLLYVSLPALFFRILARTPFEQLNNPPFVIATTLTTAIGFTLAALVALAMGHVQRRQAVIAGLAGGYGNIGYMGPGLALATLGAKAAVPVVLIFCFDNVFAIDNTFLFLQNAAAPVALFALGVTVALRPFARMPWEVPAIITGKLVIQPLIALGLLSLLSPFDPIWVARLC
jgi:predicted permease